MAVEITFGSVEKIIKLVAEIKKAVDTAKRNQEEVVDIQERVEIVEYIVLVLAETDATTNLSMDRALESLHRALHRALELIRDCEKKDMVCLLCTARDLSKKLLRVQDDISHKLLQVMLAITVHLTIELGKKANPPRRRRGPACRHGRLEVPMGRRRATRVRTSGVQIEVSSMPKFGDKSPVSGDDLTEIFAKCRAEKATGSGHATLAACHHECPSDDLRSSGFLLSICKDILLEWVQRITSQIREKLCFSTLSSRSSFGTSSNQFAGVIIDDGPSNGVASGISDKGQTKGKTGVEDISATISGLKMFSFSELNAATNNFSDNRVIGKGGYSIVYKGVLHDGLVVALKVLLDSHLEDAQTWLFDEVNIGAKLKHKNVVRHLGYSMETEMVQKRTHVLVLDYLPNGSLGDVVKGEKLIEWSSCFRIIQDIAQGVHYLHEQRVIHGDLKPDNILFDTHMNPVIIDFGKSIILDPDIDEEMLDRPVGTLGYMAPETYESCRLSMKSDVFAFGVCLVRTVIFLSTGRHDWYDAQDWKRTLQKDGGMKGVLLPKLNIDKSPIMEINRHLEVGWLCTDMDPAKRPTMADVVQMLSGEKQLPAKEKSRRGKGRRP